MLFLNIQLIVLSKPPKTAPPLLLPLLLLCPFLSPLPPPENEYRSYLVTCSLIVSYFLLSNSPFAAAEAEKRSRSCSSTEE